MRTLEPTRVFRCEKCGAGGVATDNVAPRLRYCDANPDYCRLGKVSDHFHVTCTVCRWEWVEPSKPKVFEMVETGEYVG